MIKASTNNVVIEDHVTLSKRYMLLSTKTVVTNFGQHKDFKVPIQFKLIPKIYYFY